MSLRRIGVKGVWPLPALDHRGSLEKMLGRGAGERAVVEWKKIALKHLAPMAPAVLMDVDYGLKAYRELGLKRPPYLLAIEESGYRGSKNNRVTELAYTVSELKKKGAAAVKLLIYYNPEAAMAGRQLETIKKVAAQCQRAKIPFLLEIVTYAAARARRDKVWLIKAAVGDVLGAGARVDIFKLEFPGEMEAAAARRQAGRYCREITEMLGRTPWILLSAGADYEKFKKQVRVAIKNGARGFLAGRALWQDFGKHRDQEKFFRTVVVKRFGEITRIALRGNREGLREKNYFDD